MKRYIPIIVAITVMILMTVKRDLMKFINRDDLTQYIHDHPSGVSVLVYLFFAILTLSIACTVYSVIVMYYLRKYPGDSREK
jgi:hypothetical protein